MSVHSPDEVKKEVKIYIGVFVALMVLTVLTVAASYLDVAVAIGIFIAILIATIKGGLVAMFFMHLRSEKVLIYLSLFIMFIFFLALMIVPAAMQANTFSHNAD